MPADTRYRPPIKGTSREIPFSTLVIQADPDWARAKHNEIEFITSNGRVFRGDPNRRGAYAPED